MGKRRCRVTLPVLVVVTAIIYIYFTTIFVFIDRWFGLWSSPGLFNAFLFTAISAMSVFNYAVAIFTDPGCVPVSFLPDVEDSDIQEIKRKVLLLGSIISDTGKDEPQNEGSSRTIYVISCLLLFPLTIALGVLLVWHIYLILRNKTTIEYYEGVRAMWLAEKGGEVYKHPYDLGAFENLTSALGPNIFSWVCPTNSHIGLGLRFPTAYDKLAESSSK